MCVFSVDCLFGNAKFETKILKFYLLTVTMITKPPRSITTQFYLFLLKLVALAMFAIFLYLAAG